MPIVPGVYSRTFWPNSSPGYVLCLFKLPACLFTGSAEHCPYFEPEDTVERRFLMPSENDFVASQDPSLNSSFCCYYFGRRSTHAVPLTQVSSFLQRLLKLHCLDQIGQAIGPNCTLAAVIATRTSIYSC